jgi:prepilin-type N-terminal cleavage/methylation domain-containing protein
MTKRRGFTLIEALTVIAVIGILATLTTYVVTQAQRQARDATRKSNLTAIAVTFQARYEAQTCSGAAQQRYPGYTNEENANDWQPVSSLDSYVDDCGAFSEYLATIPVEPRHAATFPYIFNLSRQGGVIGKHFRLAAKLEQPPSVRQQEENARQSDNWQINFGGMPYELDYDYFLGN